MDIKEAIIHARQVADGCGVDGRDCAYQHYKLVDWLEELVAYRVKIPFNRLDEAAALVEAKIQHKAYRVDGFYCNICAKKHMRVVEVDGIYLTRAEAEAALNGGGGDG